MYGEDAQVLPVKEMPVVLLELLAALLADEPDSRTPDIDG
jgi:hypothetical protein